MMISKPTLAVFAVYVAGVLTMPVYRRLHASLDPHLPMANDPAFYSAARASFKEVPASRDLVFIGDSRVALGLWNERFPERQVSNRGINGDTCAGVLARIGTDVPLGTGTVVVEVGINDLYDGATPELVAGGLAQIVAALKERHVGQIFLCSVVPVTAAMDASLHCNARAARTNALAEKVAGVQWVDLTALAPQGALEKSYSWDGVHFTGDAYLSWCAALRADHAWAARNVATTDATY